MAEEVVPCTFRSGGWKVGTGGMELECESMVEPGPSETGLGHDKIFPTGWLEVAMGVPSENSMHAGAQKRNGYRWKWWSKMKTDGNTRPCESMGYDRCQCTQNCRFSRTGRKSRELYIGMLNLST